MFCVKLIVICARFPLAECTRILNRFKYSPLRPDLAEKRAALENSEESSEQVLEQFGPMVPDQINISNIRLDLRGVGHIFIGDLTNKGVHFLTPILTEWVKLVGQELADRIVIQL